jgi:hypothetical protein
MRKITTTIRPDETIEVEEDEFLDLERQGLVKEDKTAKKDLPEGARANA